MRTGQRNRESQVRASCPTAAAEIRRSGMLLKTRHDLIARYDGSDKILARGAFALRHRQDGRNVKAWMTWIGTGMPIHEVKKAQRRAIHQCGFLARCKMLSTENAGLRRSGKRQRRLPHLLSRCAIRAGDHAPQGIEQTPAGLANNFSGQVVKTNLASKINETFRNRTHRIFQPPNPTHSRSSRRISRLRSESQPRLCLA